MVLIHKQNRNNKRKKLQKIKKAESKNKKSDRPKYYEKLHKYEARKNKRFRILNKRIGHLSKQKPDEHNRKVIPIDKHFDIDGNADNLAKLTKEVDLIISKYITLNFSINHKNIETISVAGMLYLVGQISKLTYAKYHDGNHHMRFNEEYGLRDDMKIRHLFEQVGYWKYFGIKNAPYIIDKTTEDSYFLSIRSSTEDKFNFLNDIKQFINNNVDLLKHEYIIEYRFDDAIKEAMGNSLEHAYPDGFDEVGKIKGKWWICGHYDKINEAIELVFYDYGIGIRESMKINLGEDADIAIIDRIKDARIFKSDADLIEMAINNGLSKYKNYLEHDRGKGFKRFKDFAKVSGHDCELSIVSNSGKYKMSYNASRDEERIEKSKLSGSIDGMLITWKINMKRGE